MTPKKMPEHYPAQMRRRGLETALRNVGITVDIGGSHIKIHVPENPAVKTCLILHHSESKVNGSDLSRILKFAEQVAGREALLRETHKHK